MEVGFFIIKEIKPTLYVGKKSFKNGVSEKINYKANY